MNDDERYVREVERKAARIARARARPRGLWQHVAHVGALGFVFVGPLLIGALLGHALARRMGRLWPALAGLALGLAVGSFATWQYLWQSLPRGKP